MESELWKKIEALYRAALAQPIERRDEFLVKPVPMISNSAARCSLS